MPAGRTLTIVLRAPARVYWGINGWSGIKDTDTRDIGIGLHVVDLAVTALIAGNTIEFTFFGLASQNWDGNDFRIGVIAVKETSLAFGQLRAELVSANPMGDGP